MPESEKISIAEQIAEVSMWENLARAGADHRGEAGLARRADRLAAAKRTLEWVRDNADALRAAVRRNEPAGPPAVRRWNELPPSTQAALRCADGRFQKFLNARDADHAVELVCSGCNVGSRRDLDDRAEAAEMWRALDGSFVAWLNGIGEAAE